VTVSRPAQLGAGDAVRIGGVTHTIAGLSGGLVHLVDAAGIKSVASLAELFSSPPGTVVLPAPRKAPLPPQGLLRVSRPALWNELAGGSSTSSRCSPGCRRKPARAPRPVRAMTRT
jgi:hypothetical protein